jgi:hypothetical protein
MKDDDMEFEFQPLDIKRQDLYKKVKEKWEHVLHDERVSGDDMFKLSEKLNTCFLDHTELMNERHGINGGGEGHLERYGHTSGKSKPQNRYRGALS